MSSLLGPLTGGLLGLLLLARSAMADEVVVTQFDLSGWTARGAVTLGSDTFDGASLRRLVDGSMSTGVRADVAGRVLISLAFQNTHDVREVILVPGLEGSFSAQLSVLLANGSFVELDERTFGGGAPAVWKTADTRLRGLELRVQGIELEHFVQLVELRVVGELTIRELLLENVPEELPEGGTFRPRLMGVDAYGGQPDLSNIARLQVTPEPALEDRGDGRYRARVGGSITFVPRLGSLQGATRWLLVRPRDPAPPAPSVLPSSEFVQLLTPGTPPLQILRRATGDNQVRPVGITWNGHFVDESAEPGGSYAYSVVGVDRFGNATTDLSPEVRHRATRRQVPGLFEVGRCPVLVALYVDSFDRLGITGEAQRITESIQVASAFLYRHSLGRVALDLSFVNVRGPTPNTSGPSMAGIERDLRDLGVPDDAFAAVFAVSNDLQGAHGNFTLLGRTGGAMGRGPGVPTPAGALGPDPDVAWVFLHELRHVIAGRLGPAAGFHDMASGDLAQDFRFGPLGSFRGRPLDTGDAWDGQALLARDTSFWDRLEAPWRRPMEVLDSDGDGLADVDPRLPLDELRLGTDAVRPDTDSDGLPDLQELAAGLYEGSDPLVPDSDRDGLPDGVDPWPVSNFTGVIPFGDEPVLLASGPLPGRPVVTLSACWTPETLILSVTTPFQAHVFIDLDGSGELGRFESDVDLGVPGQPGSDVWAGASRIALRAHAAPVGVTLGGVPVPDATLSTGLTEQGAHTITVRLPPTLGPGSPDATVSPYASRAPGLRLSAGRVLGLGVIVRPVSTSDVAPAIQAYTPDGRWTSLFETHRLYDAVLQTPPER